MAHLKLDTLHVQRSPRGSRRSSPSSGRSSACSSGSISPVPIIPIISISHDGDESESESEIETEPVRLFQRRMSTKCTNNLVSSKTWSYSYCFGDTRDFV
uniref:GG14230 n=1 Tax=Drosophila erecta TaxID=7220 RepID=B3NYS3_DROER